MIQKALGIDLASRSWKDNGSCLVSFERRSPAWVAVRSQAVDWPASSLTASHMADVLAKYIRDNQVAGISLDGPQGWREPNAAPRKGVGRLCEYEARCQGKTGEFGTTYPAPQRGWIEFCIEVFERLRERGGQVPSASTAEEGLPSLPRDQFWLIECFPTSIWQTSGLPVLPGKGRCQRDQTDLIPFRNALNTAYQLPLDEAITATHDDLQALVSALPIAGLLGGPAKPVRRGKDTWQCEDGHWVEGIIWDSEPLEPANEVNSDQTQTSAAEIMVQHVLTDFDSKNPIVLDDRDDDSIPFYDSGIALFKQLCDLHDQGKTFGVGYSQFVEIVYSVEKFSDLMGRNYATPDTRYVLDLASQITEEAGGRRDISRNGVTIPAGMDTFIWPTTPPHRRNEAAFSSTPYTAEQWLAVFPDSARKLISKRELA